MELSPAEMALRGRIGAYALHSRHDPRETTAKARATFLEGFERQVDPDGTLSLAERQRRAEFARKAHFARLAIVSATKRSGNKTTAGRAIPAVAEIVTEDLVDADIIDDVPASV
jgi:hypothetical protein